MAIFEIEGVRIAYDRPDHGASGSGVVLLHAFPLSRLMWERQVEDLGGTHDLVVPDMRGHGASDVVDAPTSIEQMADDVHGLVGALGVGPATLVGLSMGGYVALAYARKYPHDLRALVLADTRAQADSEEGRAGRFAMIRDVAENGPASIATAMLPKLLSERAVEEQPALVVEVRRMIETTSPAGIAGALVAMAGRPDSTPMLSSISVPTLVIAGELDAVVGVEEGRRMASEIPGARFEVIADCGHLSNMEKPTEFTTLLRDFLSAL